jgi:hypothetical protein
MLTGPALGHAIETAIRLKGVNRSEVARHFGVKPESTYDWTKHGRIAKRHLPRLFEYFADVVGPDHWGLEAGAFGFAPPSQQVGLDLDILRVALIALREAAEAEDKEIDLYESAPIIAYAYRERAAMREAPTKAQLREFDESIRKKLRGEEGVGGWRGRAAEAGQGGNAKDAAKAAENGTRAAGRKRRAAGSGG